MSLLILLIILLFLALVMAIGRKAVKLMRKINQDKKDEYIKQLKEAANHK